MLQMCLVPEKIGGNNFDRDNSTINQWIVQDTLSSDQPSHNTFVSHVSGPRNVHVGIVENSTFQIISEFECLYVCGLADRIFKFIDYTTTFCLIQQHFLSKIWKFQMGSYINMSSKTILCGDFVSEFFEMTSLPCWLWPEFYWGTHSIEVIFNDYHGDVCNPLPSGNDCYIANSWTWPFK